MESEIKYILVDGRKEAIFGKPPREVIAAYLPSNYKVVASTESGWVLVRGRDDHGWTAEGYVIPRLGSCLIPATMMNPTEPETVDRYCWDSKEGQGNG